MKTSTASLVKSNWLALLEHTSRLHPVMTFLFLTFALPIALLASVAGGAVMIALPFMLF